MSGQMIAFFVIAGAVLTGAVYIVTTKNIMHAVFMHLMMLSLVAGIYVLLTAEFIAAMQVLIYAGAVTIMVIFALMLTKSQITKDGIGMAVDNQQKGLAFLTAAGFLAMLLFVLIPQKWTAYEVMRGRPDVAYLGKVIFSSYVLPFELIGVLLLTALVGVIVLTKKEAGT